MIKEKNRVKSNEVFIDSDKGMSYDKVIRETEERLIKQALNRSFGNQSIAAKLLGINRNTLRTKIRKLEINTREFRI